MGKVLLNKQHLNVISCHLYSKILNTTYLLSMLGYLQKKNMLKKVYTKNK